MFLLLAVLPCVIFATDAQQLKNAFEAEPPPFGYDLNIKLYNGASRDEPLMIACHGYGSNAILGDILRTNPQIRGPIVSFNFPDHDIMERGYDPKDSVFGTVQEILPLLYVLKESVSRAGADKVNLYGFSAGGGAVINTIAALNSHHFDAAMQRIGITEQDKVAILDAIQKGVVILDCPLKSVDEIIGVRGQNPTLDAVSERYRVNHMRPIDALQSLQGLSLNVLVYFEVPDEALSNRDDALYIRQLRQYNKGKTVPVMGTTTGHNDYHPVLWHTYSQFVENPRTF